MLFEKEKGILVYLPCGVRNLVSMPFFARKLRATAILSMRCTGNIARLLYLPTVSPVQLLYNDKMRKNGF